MHQVEMDTPLVHTSPIEGPVTQVDQAAQANFSAQADEAAHVKSDAAGHPKFLLGMPSCPVNDPPARPFHQQMPTKPVQSPMKIISATKSSFQRAIRSISWGLAASLTAGLLMVSGAQAQVAIQNCATITSFDQADSNLLNNQACADISVPASADLSLTKTVDNPAAGVGGAVTFTVTLTNIGPSTATGIVVRDPEPTGFTFGLATSDVGGVWDPILKTWTVATLTSGASITLTIPATVDAAGNYTNVAEVMVSVVPDPDSTPGNGDINEDDYASVTVTPAGGPPPVNPPPTGAVLSITKAANPAIGDSDADGNPEASFTVTIANTGTASTTYSATDTANLLPAGVTVSEIISLSAATTGANDPTPNLNPAYDGGATTALLSAAQTIGAGETHTFTIVVEYAIDTGTVDYANLTCTGAPNLGFYNEAQLTFNNKTVVATNIASSVVGTFVTGGLLFPENPSLTGFAIPAGNERGLVIHAGFEREALAALLFSNFTGGSSPDVTVNVTGPGGTINRNTTFSFASFSTLLLFGFAKELHTAVFTEADIDFLMGGNNGGSVDVTLTYSNPGLLTGDDAYVVATALNNVDPAAGGLAIAAQETATWQSVAGDFTIASGPFNPGTDTTDAGDAVLVNGFSFAGVEQGTYGYLTPAGYLNIDANANANILSVFGLLVPDSEPSGMSTNTFFTNGAASSVSIQSALANATQTYEGEMSVVTAQVASNILGASACADGNFIDLELEKSANSLNAIAGDTITFTVTVTNAGGVDATGVVVTDLLPSGFAYDTHATAQGNYVPGTGLWTIGGLTQGSTATLLISAIVNAGGAVSDYLNLAEVTAADQFDADSTPNNGVDTNNNGNFVDDPGDEDDGDGVQISVDGISISKTASAIALDGATQGKVRYVFTVQNTSATNTLIYDLIDTIDYDNSLPLPVTGTLVRQSDPGVVVASHILDDGVPTVLIAGESLAPGATEDWELLVDLGSVPLTLTGGTTDLLALTGCNPGTPVAGVGLYNSADLAPSGTGVGGALGLNAEACPTGNNRGLLITKQASAVVSALPSGNLRAVYDVIVYNPGLATTYSLVDTFEFDPAFTVVASQLLINPNSLGTADLTGFTASGAINANSAHQFRIQVDVSHATGPVATALADVGACDATSPQAGVGMTNQAVLTGPSGVPIEALACPTGDGAGGTVSFDKEVVSLVNIDPDTLEVVYTLTVDNTTAAAATYDLADAFGFDPAFTVVPGSVSVTATPGGIVPSPTFDGTTSPTIVAGETIAGGATHVYTIRVRVDYAGGDINGAITGCNTTAPQPGTGLYNMGVLTVNGIPVSDEACPGGTELIFSKLASFVGYEGNGRFKVAYKISVQNLRPTAVTYNLVDTPDFAAGLVVTSATLSLNGGAAAPFAGLASGAPSTLASNVPLAANGTDTYYLEVIIDASALATVTDQFTAFASCNPGNPTAGTGAYNSAVFTVGVQAFPPVEACPDGNEGPVFASKIASAVANLGGGRLRIIYDVEVTNVGTTTVAYDLADAFAFDPGFSVDSLTLLASPAGTVSTGTGFTGTNVDVIGNSSNIYRVEVIVQHGSGDAATAVTASGTCDPGDPTPNTGLYNGATVKGPNGVPVTVEACPPGVVITKSALSAVEVAANRVDVVYQITVENNASVAHDYYLVDQVNLGPGFFVLAGTTNVTVNPGSVALNPTFNGVTETNVTAVGAGNAPLDQTIAAGSTHTFTISMSIIYTGTGVFDTEVNACSPALPTPKTGLYNSAALVVGGIPTLAEACPNLSDLTLYKLANPAANVQAGDTISYTFAIENNGSSAVSSLTLSDPTVSNLSCAATSVGGSALTWASTGSQANTTAGSLPVGDQAICTAVYTVTAGDVTAGSVVNTASATAVDGGGATLTATASATVTTEGSGVGKLIDVTKTVVSFADTVTANNRLDVGETVTYEIRVVNSGPTPLTNVQVSDTLILPANLSCAPTLGSGLASGATMLCTGSHTVTNGDLAVATANLGVLVNTATATAQDPGGATVSDRDSASITLDPAAITPAIDLSKYLIRFTDSDGNGGYSVGDDLVYGFTIVNTGADTLTGVTLSDDLLPGAFISCSTLLPANLAPLTAITCDAMYTIDALDISIEPGTGNEILVNTATASGAAASDPALIVTDIEQLILRIFPNLLDYGDLPDSYDGVAGSGDDASHRLDAGLFLGALAPDEEAGKQAPLDGTGDDVTGVDDEDAITTSLPLSLASSSYSLDVTVTTPATGACSAAPAFTLAGWIDFNNDGQFQANERSGVFGVGPSTVAGTATLSWPSLPGLVAAGASGYAVRLRLFEGTIADPQPIDFGSCGEVEDGYITSSDPDFGDAASSYEGGNPASHTPGGIQLGAVAPDGEAAPQPNGSLTGDDLAGVDDEDGIDTATFLPYGVGADTYDLNVITGQVPAQGGVVAGCADFNDNGTFDVGEIVYTDLAANQSAATLSWSGLNALPATTPASGNYTLRLRVFERQAVETVAGTIDPALVVCNGPGGVGEVEDHALLAVLPQVIIARKSADVATVQVGDFIQWTLEFENTLAGPLNNVTLRDWLPAGVAYVAGSARLQRVGIDPAPVAAEPTISGGSILTWAPYDFQAAGSAGDTIQISILTTVGTVAVGATLENRDQALTAAGLPLSNIGRAFVTVEASGVFDCSDIIGTVFEDKNANGYQDKGEGGLAGVNIYTARGLKITVDRYGRYHVPCGATPDERGQNFILKLHEQTLPLGCQLTTENPRVVRLTPGKLTKANFGASCGKTVSVFLCDDVFVAGSTQVLDTWRPQVGQIVDMMKRAPVSLNITHATRGDLSLAQRRLARLSRYLNQATASGQFQSTISTGVTNDVSRCPEKAPEPVPIEVCNVPTRYAIKSMISYCQGLRDLVVQEYYSYQPLGTLVENYNTYVRGVETWKADYKQVIANQNSWPRQRIQDGYLRLTQRYHQLMTYRNTYVVPGGAGQ